MKRKTITRKEWRGIYRRSYAEKRFDEGGFKGIAGLLFMDDAEEFCVRSGTKKLKITDRGYSWLQLAAENSHVWATVMFDDKGKVFQCYFDISAQNYVLDSGKSCFDDLYLDVVALTDSDQFFLYDEDELEQAFEDGEIDAVTRQVAYKARDELISYLHKNKDMFFKRCAKIRSELMPMLKLI